MTYPRPCSIYSRETLGFRDPDMVRGFVQGSICCPGEESVNESPPGACFCRCDFYLEGHYGLSKYINLGDHWHTKSQ